MRLVLFCPKADGLCEGKVTVRADKQTVASKEFNQRGGAKFTLAVKLSSSARRRIAKASKIQALVLSRDTVGFATRLTRTLKR